MDDLELLHKNDNELTPSELEIKKYILAQQSRINTLEKKILKQINKIDKLEQKTNEQQLLIEQLLKLVEKKNFNVLVKF